MIVKRFLNLAIWTRGRFGPLSGPRAAGILIVASCSWLWSAMPPIKHSSRGRTSVSPSDERQLPPARPDGRPALLPSVHAPRVGERPSFPLLISDYP